MNYQPVAVTLVLGHWSVKNTLKRMMGLNKVKLSGESKCFSLKVVEFLKTVFPLFSGSEDAFCFAVTVFHSDLVLDGDQL